ncbi:hypothetical protein F0L74_27195 [Chitinophaga agrisoli]|uniref:Secreted protein n=1 Tax=Chitinophaga agrisoli TaxID=2607653 RepID=A0A5B2VLU2_9BACT|nr:hypothetical protein [Chitinophaga agrisoli]KAA2239875.1 hypothetical protein F0L74_27195 [Chitinophaga agrisoli]
MKRARILLGVLCVVIAGAAAAATRITTVRQIYWYQDTVVGACNPISIFEECNGPGTGCVTTVAQHGTVQLYDDIDHNDQSKCIIPLSPEP